MKLKKLFDNPERHILDQLVYLIGNSWARGNRIKRAAQRTKNISDEDIQNIEQAVEYQLEELISVAVEICQLLDIPLDRLGNKLTDRLEWADNINEKGVKFETKPDNDGWWPAPFGYEENPNGPKGSILRVNKKHFLFDWRSIVADIPNKK